MRNRSLARSSMIAGKGTLSSHGMQRGGLDPLRSVPPFKYTTMNKRRELSAHLYPYGDYLLEITRKTTMDDYHYHGPVYYKDCEYILDKFGEATEDYTIGETRIGTFRNAETVNRETGEVTRSTATMFYFGGFVY